jgi:predicted N-formylglutamate amidohydrolase
MFPDDACEVIAASDAAAPMIITCEHASNRLPAPWRWAEGDRWLERTHWAFDIGAAELTRELARASGAAAVLAGFSRLLVDPNRSLGAPTLIRGHAEGRAILLNAAVDQRERRRRVRYWEAFHHAADRAARTSRAPILLAVHSFTPEYEGSRREVEIGVLFDREEALARRLAERLAPLGQVRFNEPYSGKAGLMYSAQRHADATHKRPIELEIRQDRAADRAFRAELVVGVCAALASEAVAR